MQFGVGTHRGRVEATSATTNTCECLWIAPRRDVWVEDRSHHIARESSKRNINCRDMFAWHKKKWASNERKSQALAPKKKALNNLEPKQQVPKAPAPWKQARKPPAPRAKCRARARGAKAPRTQATTPKSEAHKTTMRQAKHLCRTNNSFLLRDICPHASKISLLVLRQS